MTDSIYISLGVTVIVETIILLLLVRRWRWWKIVLYGLLVNCLTQPLATYSYRQLIHNLAVVEVAVFLAEAILLKWLFRLSLKQAAVYSLITNGLTALIGARLYFT